jgi:hypothetical protein
MWMGLNTLGTSLGFGGGDCLMQEFHEFQVSELAVSTMDDVTMHISYLDLSFRPLMNSGAVERKSMLYIRLK